MIEKQDTVLIKYENWPIVVRAVTAFKIGKAHISKESGITVLGYIMALIGISILVLVALYGKEVGIFKDNLLAGLGFLLIGLMNVINGYSISWINRKSCWSERYLNKPQLVDKLGGLLLFSLTILALIVMIKGFDIDWNRQ